MGFEDEIWVFFGECWLDDLLLLFDLIMGILLFVFVLKIESNKINDYILLLVFELLGCLRFR